jgi:hypothetical protein
MINPRVSVSVACGLLFGAVFLVPFAYFCSSAAYHILRRGNFHSTALDKTVTTYTAAGDPAIYWKTALGFSFIGGLLDLLILGFIAIAIYSLAHSRQTNPPHI